MGFIFFLVDEDAHRDCEDHGRIEVEGGREPFSLKGVDDEFVKGVGFA